MLLRAVSGHVIPAYPTLFIHAPGATRRFRGEDSSSVTDLAARSVERMIAPKTVAMTLLATGKRAVYALAFSRIDRPLPTGTTRARIRRLTGQERHVY